ncbi:MULTISPECIES: hypothetical protein [unclassified Streptomyces]|uniref:hypothetical protein n=1 Tax=unclassified Streptomyces TaxID=2593676 RepID=UPI0004C37F7E
MSAARRPLLTATAAGTLLCALWFVPSANASDGAAGPGVRGGSTAPAESSDPAPTAYVVAGTGFLAVGTGFVALALRRHGRAS